MRDDAAKLDGINVHCFSGCDWRDVKAALARLELIDDFFNASNPKPSLPPPPAKDDDTPLRVSNIWRTSEPLPGMLGERYLTEIRGLKLGGDLQHAVRWQKDLKAIIGLMTDPTSGEPTGVHRTFLNDDGTKRERKMLGRAGAIRLSPDEDVSEGLGVTEGIEDGLAVLAAGWAPVWSCLSCGGIERFPVLGGVECLTIFQTRTRRASAPRKRALHDGQAGREAFLA